MDYLLGYLPASVYLLFHVGMNECMNIRRLFVPTFVFVSFFLSSICNSRIRYCERMFSVNFSQRVFRIGTGPFEYTYINMNELIA